MTSINRRQFVQSGAIASAWGVLPGEQLPPTAMTSPGENERSAQRHDEQPHSSGTRDTQVPADRAVALVTGATRGLGLETARQLGERGLRVLLGARNLESGRARATELQAAGLDVHAVELDLNDAATIDRAAAMISEKFGRLDILVNNAGIFLGETDGLPSLASADAIRKTFEVNFFGTVLVTQRMLPLLKKAKHGRIVNVSSSVGSLGMNADPRNPLPGGKWLGYSASKAALNMLTVLLAYELRDTPIKVNSICPGYVKTDMNGGEGAVTVEEGVKASIRYALLDDAGPSGGFFAVDGPRVW